MQLKYCEYSNTVRQWPENYCLCVRPGPFSDWTVKPDQGLALNTVLAATQAIHTSHAVKWGGPAPLIAAINNLLVEG